MSEYLLSSISSDLVFRGTNYLHVSNAGVSLSLFEYLGLIAQYLEELFKLFLIVLVPLLSEILNLLLLFLKYLQSCFSCNHFKTFIILSSTFFILSVSQYFFSQRSNVLLSYLSFFIP